MRWWLLAAVSASVLSGGSVSGAPLAGPLAEKLTIAAAAHGVPRELLIAIAVVEECLDIPARRTVEPDAHVHLAGPLCLRHGKRNTLAEGAALLGVSELALEEDADLALEAGARVLANIAHEQGIPGTGDLARWAPVLAELSGFADELHRRWYVHQVFATLAKGGTFLARDGERVSLGSHVVPAELTSTIPLVPPSDLGETMGVDFPGAEWFATDCSGKCDLSRGGNTVQYVVIHDTEGGWAGSVATLQNDPGKSVHYIIGTDGRLGQFVNETVTAWHAGNYPYNQRSVGIEHVGHWNKSEYTEVEYAKSAALVAYLTKKYVIAKDRAHIIGHDQVPASGSGPACTLAPKDCEASSSWGGAGHHTDPGLWEWCTYMARLGGTCKCNDIWPLWNCSFDGKKAFRCDAGKIEIDSCDGPGACETMPVGTPDVCHKKPSIDPDAGASDAGPETGDAGPVGTDTGTADAGPALAADGGEAGCGCRATPVRGAPFGWLALVALGLRRRQRGRA